MIDKTNRQTDRDRQIDRDRVKGRRDRREKEREREREGGGGGGESEREKKKEKESLRVEEKEGSGSGYQWIRILLIFNYRIWVIISPIQFLCVQPNNFCNRYQASAFLKFIRQNLLEMKSNSIFPLTFTHLSL